MRTQVAAELGHDLRHRPRGDQVVDDRGARFLGQLAGGDQGGEHARADQLATLVDEEAPVGVAVEGQTDVGTGLDHLGLQVDEVGGLDRVGLVVREGAVELEEQRHEVDVDPAEHRRRGEPGHAVARVDDHREVTAVHRRQREQVGGVVVQHVLLGDASGRLGDRRLTPGDAVADLGEPGLHADGRGERTAHLDAVVAGRVVARGEHRARALHPARREVELVGRGQPDQHHVGACLGRTLGERAGHPRRGGPHVVADDDGIGSGDHDEGVAHRGGRGPRRSGRARCRGRRTP